MEYLSVHIDPAAIMASANSPMSKNDDFRDFGEKSGSVLWVG